MSERPRLELTTDEQREADEYNRIMGVMHATVRRVNGPAAPSFRELFPEAIPIGKMEDAAISGKLWRVKQALNDGADPNEPSAMFGTALHGATHEGHLETVQLLVESGANTSSRDGKGRTACEAAVAWGQTAVADFLRKLA